MLNDVLNDLNYQYGGSIVLHMTSLEIDAALQCICPCVSPLEIRNKGAVVIIKLSRHTYQRILPRLKTVSPFSFFLNQTYLILTELI
jgi:hydrogenase maturation factor